MQLAIKQLAPEDFRNLQGLKINETYHYTAPRRPTK
jgi:hypothetical protein